MTGGDRPPVRRPVLLCLSDYPTDLVTSWLADTDTEVVIADRARTVDALEEPLRQATVVIADASRTLFLDAAAVGLLECCRAVIVPAVGIEGSVDVAALQRAGIPVLGAPGYNAEAVADWTVWAMLEGLRWPRDLRQTGWGAGELGRELGAVTVGLVGLGATGSAVRRRLLAFGTRVRYSSPSPHAEPGRVPLAELFASCDVVSLHLPLTDETRGSVSSALLESMPQDSLLVNAARGAVVDEEALVLALRAGRPARAVLDVFAVEPLPADHPLRDLPNVRLTPHVAASTVEARLRVRALVRTRVREVLGLPAA